MSNILFYTIFTHAFDLEVKVTDLHVYIYDFVKSFVITFHPNPLLDLTYISYDNRFLFTILFYTIPTHTLTEGQGHRLTLCLNSYFCLFSLSSLIGLFDRFVTYG